MVTKKDKSESTSILSALKGEKLSSGKTLLIILGCAVLMLIYVWKQVEMDNALQEIERLNKDVSKQEQLNELTKMEIINLESFKNIENFAKDELNLVFPKAKSDVLIMKTNEKPSIKGASNE